MLLQDEGGCEVMMCALDREGARVAPVKVGRVYRGWHVRESDQRWSEVALVPGWPFLKPSLSSAHKPK